MEIKVRFFICNFKLFVPFLIIHPNKFWKRNIFYDVSYQNRVLRWYGLNSLKENMYCIYTHLFHKTEPKSLRSI